MGKEIKMKSVCVIAVLLLAAVSASASASATTNWVWLGDKEGASIYIDAASVTHVPAYVKLWTMLSYKSEQRGGWRSQKRLFLFSCKNQTLEWEQSMYFAGSMGEGDFVNTRARSRFGLEDLKLGELDPSTTDPKLYSKAVPESNFIASFKSLC
jgi:hypothetical protein